MSRKQVFHILIASLIALASTGCVTTMLLDHTQEKIEHDEALKDTLDREEWAEIPEGTRLLIMLKNQELLRAVSMGINNPDTLYVEVTPQRRFIFERKEARSIPMDSIQDVIRFHGDKIPRTFGIVVGLTFDAALFALLYYFFSIEPGPMYGS